MATSKISPKTQEDALAIAKSTQRPGQTKAQTKLISQGIEKGIAEYKKQQKVKARARDKAKKKDISNNPDIASIASERSEEKSSVFQNYVLAWSLLFGTWGVIVLLVLALKFGFINL